MSQITIKDHERTGETSDGLEMVALRGEKKTGGGACEYQKSCLWDKAKGARLKIKRIFPYQKGNLEEQRGGNGFRDENGEMEAEALLLQTLNKTDF